MQAPADDCCGAAAELSVIVCLPQVGHVAQNFDQDLSVAHKIGDGSVFIGTEQAAPRAAQADGDGRYGVLCRKQV